MNALRKGLVAAQVALALVLLVGAGLLLSSFRHLLAVDPGLDPDGVLSGTVMLTSNRYPEPVDRRRFVEESLRQIDALPGVEHAAVTSHVPFGGNFSDSVIFAEGYVMKEGESAISPTQVAVSDAYFQAMGIDLREGRLFDSRDSSDSRPVVIIDEHLASRFWPEGDALGKRMWMPGSAEDMMNPETADYFDIVGIVESVQMRGLATERDDVGLYYFPMSQSVRRSLDFTIKTSGDPRAVIAPVRAILTGIDPEMPLFDIRTLSERIARSVSDRRTPMILTAGFSVAALLLAAIGIYGMLAYLVQRRTREIGVRVALGSDTSGIFGLILKDGLIVLAVGLSLGLGGAILLRRIIEGHLFGVSALDPGVIGTVLLVLATVAVLACVVPARRATRIEPVRALAQE